jgi:hypothetical protein
MANIRNTFTGVGGRFPSRVKGTQAAFSMNTFGLNKLEAGINGEHLSEIAYDAMEVAEEMAKEEWPKDTHASVETIERVIYEVNERSCRVALQIGGQKLIEDPRNKSHKDYAPYVEYNGTPKTAPGTLAHVMAVTEPEIKERMRNGVRQLIQDLLV